ncbi:putative nucleotidyltransferase [Leptolyngbya sp. BL0902]|uniref:nucleotidyltransferase domain-containing protein n=1 Tax=Leptolyngbya sp. BL0902 TaxID=1115757 RepID=UPI001935EBFB|nr:nucleotidyltransferase domain-containing protein [Leptolyngbya sp. BL0902]QQE66554.1 putative nucleotidyltransferase [Leptolyngbya sp. BL0902]
MLYADALLRGYHATIANPRWPMPLPLPPTPVPWLQVMTDRIVEQFDPLKIILFGSHARGDATADSDIDLLVVFAELTHKRETTIAIRSILADLPVAKDIVVTTPAEIKEYGDLVGPILRPALREGKVIYERDE